MSRIHRVLSVLAIVVATICVGFSASADGGVGTFGGAGDVVPGLGSIAPALQSWTMEGIAQFVEGNGTVHNVACNVVGNSVAPGENLAAGAGTMTMSCGTLVAHFCVYERVTVQLTIACADTGDGVIEGAVLVLIPNQTPPAPIVGYTFNGLIVATAVGSTCIPC